MTGRPDPRVDAYIERAAAFARPILRHLREQVHRACPEVVETMKWSRPFFEHHGLLCAMAAFKEHCAFMFWHPQMNRVAGAVAAGRSAAMGQFGRITALDDLPRDRILQQYLREAIRLNESDAPASPRARAKRRPELPVPADLAAALRKDKPAAKTFREFSPRQRREYIEWITEARRDETRAKRLATTIEWLAEGKSRNWKYAAR